MIIDTQTHYVPPAARRLLEDVRWCGAKPSGLPANLDDDHPLLSLDTRLHEMDRHGIDVSVLSFAPVGMAPDAALDRDLARAANDGLVAACEAYPSRFVAIARLPLVDSGDAVKEACHVVRAPCIRGLSLLAEAVRYRPDQLDLEPLWLLAAERRLAVVLHPPAGVADISDAFADYGLNSALHAMVGSTLTLARLIYSGVLDRHPLLDIIATHFGGVAPFLAERFDSRGKGAAQPFTYYLRNRLYLDNCGFPAEAALKCAITAAGADRIVLGSDWPSRPVAECLAPLRDLTDADRGAIEGATAARWFAT